MHVKQVSFRAIFVLILASSLVVFGANYLPKSVFYKKLFSDHVENIDGIAYLEFFLFWNGNLFRNTEIDE